MKGILHTVLALTVFALSACSERNVRAEDCGCDRSADTLSNDRTVLALKGRVKSMDIRFYRPGPKGKLSRRELMNQKQPQWKKGGEYEYEGVHKTVVSFSQDGRFESIRRFSLDSVLVEEIGYTYDSAGFEKRIFHPGSEAVTVYEYDPAGRLTEQRIDRKGGKTHLEERNTYDENGRIVRRETPAYTYRARTDFIYGKDGLLKESLTYGENGNLCYRTLFAYDEAGLLAEKTTRTFIYGDDRISERTEYLYDAQGKPLKERRYQENGEFDYTLEYRYEKKGDGITETLTRSSEDGVWSLVERRDASGRRIDRPWFPGMEILTVGDSAKYEYDRCENWTWCRDYDGTYIGSSGVGIITAPMTERTFTYYED